MNPETAASSTTTGAPMIGQTISHYRIIGKLGGGGMGVVYEAEDVRLGRHVAIKFIPENLMADKKSMERFEREARAASQLNHPCICTIHEVEDHNGCPFIVMEKLEGESLKQRIHGKAMELDQLLEIAVQVADALSASHGKGIIHRDIKPANIFLTRSGQTKVLDFGLAKLIRDDHLATSEETPVEDSLTAVGVIPGTAVYMSPEQARSEPLDPRRSFFLRGSALRDGDREEALDRKQCGNHAGCHPEPKTCLPTQSESRPAQRLGGHHREGDGKGSWQTLPKRGSHES